MGTPSREFLPVLAPALPPTTHYGTQSPRIGSNVYTPTGNGDTTISDVLQSQLYSDNSFEHDLICVNRALRRLHDGYKTNAHLLWRLDDENRFAKHENAMIKERMRSVRDQNKELWARLSKVAKDGNTLQNDKRIRAELEAKIAELEISYQAAIALKQHLEKDQVATIDLHEAFKKSVEQYKDQAETEKSALQYRLDLTEQKLTCIQKQLSSVYPQLHDNLDNIIVVLQAAAEQDKLAKEVLLSHFPEIHSGFSNLGEGLRVVGKQHSLMRRVILSRFPEIHNDLRNMEEVLGAEVLEAESLAKGNHVRRKR